MCPSPPGVKQRLLNHLTNCVSGLQQVAPFPSAPTIVPPTSLPPPTPTSSLEDVNNNEASARLQMISSGLQVIPSRLPTGELALLLPGTSGLFSSPPEVSSSESTSSDRVSAFTLVDHKKIKSPSLSPTSSTDGDVLLSPHSSEVSSTSHDSIFKVPAMQPKALKGYFSPFTNESSLLMKAPSYLPNREAASSVIYRPLITTLSKPQESRRTGFSIEVDARNEAEKKNPIDFSMKKLVAPLKTPLSDLPCNVPLNKVTTKVADDGENHSTSTAITNSVPACSSSESSSRDMWRPW